MKKTELIVAIFWIILGLTISIWSATFPLGSWESIGPALLPMACGLILILLGCIIFVQTKKQKRKPVRPVVSQIPQRVAFTRVALSLGGMFLSAVVFDFLGFVLTLFLLILFLMQAIQPVKWRTAIFYAFVFTLGSYLLFQFLLKTTLPHGFLGF